MPCMAAVVVNSPSRKNRQARKKREATSVGRSPSLAWINTYMKNSGWAGDMVPKDEKAAANKRDSVASRKVESSGRSTPRK